MRKARKSFPAESVCRQKACRRSWLESFAQPLLGVAVGALAGVRLVVRRTLDGLESALHLLLRRTVDPEPKTSASSIKKAKKPQRYLVP